MKNEIKKNNNTAVAKPRPDMDPMDVAKRALTEARIDYKRIKEINAGPKTEKTVNPERAGIKTRLAGIKEKRLVCAGEIKAAFALIVEKRKEIKDLFVQKKELRSTIKKVPRIAKSKAVEEAQVALLEAELAYRKACLG